IESGRHCERKRGGAEVSCDLLQSSTLSGRNRKKCPGKTGEGRIRSGRRVSARLPSAVLREPYFAVVHVQRHTDDVGGGIRRSVIAVETGVPLLAGLSEIRDAASVVV